MKFRLAILMLLVSLFAGACSKESIDEYKKDNVPGLTKIDHKMGDGAEAVPGHRVAVHYIGWLYDEKADDHKGKKFDSSLDRGTPFEFQLGAGNVIKGWDLGVAGMKVGGQRTLIISSELGYGARGAGDVIPPNAALVFDVQLLAVN